MPEYKSNRDLPESVRDSLPEQAQVIYRKAFNSAWEQYADPGERRQGRSREETAHAVAWNAVKEKYERIEQGRWRRKESRRKE